jgi:branched-chain amino acid transport system substrate-binding protein
MRAGVLFWATHSKTWPAYVGYSAYDMVHVIAEAIERAGGSTDPDKLVTGSKQPITESAGRG